MIRLIKKLFGGRTVNFKELLNKGAVVVDVRSTAEYSAGHIPGSINYPLDTIRSQVTALKKRNKPVITVCRSGARSGQATGILKSAGLEAYNGGSWTRLKTTISS